MGMKHYLLGLTGYPLGHSKSPLLHAAALRDTGLEGDYRLFPIEPETGSANGLETLMRRMRDGEIHGLNVTIPHKQAVMAYLDALSPDAQAIGAVNTIVYQQGRLIGHNTDAEGFRIDCRRSLGLAPGRALVLGAGGSARAVVHALKLDGWEIGISARQRSQASSLPVDQLLSFPVTKTQLAVFSPSLIVNTTPLGMLPRTDSSPWPDEIPFPMGCGVYDLVYNPEWTVFLRKAQKDDVKTAGGLGMLIEQAALAFEIWTGRSPSRQAMKNALAE